MEAKYTIRKQSKTKPIILLNVFDVRFPGRKFMYSTGEHIANDDWSFKSAFPKDRPAMKALRSHLKALREAVEEWGNTKLGSVTRVRGDLKKYLKNLGKDERKEHEQRMQKEIDLFKIWQRIIDETKNPKTGEAITGGTKRSKEQTLNLVTSYCIDKKATLTLQNMDMDFYHSFESYMREKSLNSNTRGKHIKEIKAIIRQAAERDYEVNQAYQKKAFKVIKKDVDTTYLSEDEIKKLLTVKLTPAKEAIRDIFAMACFVGVRHSDWHQIRKANIVKAGFLKVKQKKTGDAIHIPVHPVVRIVLNKYNGEPPRVISNQKFNDAIKEICKEGLKDENEKPLMVTIDGKSVEKWKEISTHTARRSFATNAYLSRSMSVYSIMACTGHKTEASFLKYLKLSGLDKAQDIADSKFFKDKGWTNLKVA
jgi:integrase